MKEENNEKQKVVINNCYGGFGVTDDVFEWLIKNKCWTVTGFDVEEKIIDRDAQIIDFHPEGKYLMVKGNHRFLKGKYLRYTFKDDELIRNNPDLIEAIETIGIEKSSDRLSKLKIIEIPADVEWEIHDGNGFEWIAEKHRTWR